MEMKDCPKRRVGRPRKAGGPEGRTARTEKGMSGKAPAKRRDKKVLSEKDLAEKEAMEQARREENAVLGICPFFKQDRGGGRLSCEGANIRFPDKEARREFVYRLCAHPEGYKTCPMQMTLEHYYERKYRHHE